jgi:hypothetical protein
LSWPYSPKECPQCRSFAGLDAPAFDDAGYEVVGFCRHPRIAMDLFLFKERDPETMDPCPCFRQKREE